MAARVLLLGQGAASMRATLGASTGGLWLEDAPTVADALVLARAGIPDVALVSADDDDAAQTVEDLAEAEPTASVPVVVVASAARFEGEARVLALGARVVRGGELAVRQAIDETLAARAWLAGRRVVVADDDPAITWYFADLLRAEACTVDDALDGRTALDRALATTPDLVVTDILMPHLDGIRLLRAMRADPVLRDVPAVLLSWNEDWLAQARESGTEAWGYLAKRADPEVALTCLRSALSGRVQLENRMRRVGAVRGVLDDTTPHRLLTLSSICRPDCRLSVRDGESLHEVQLRAGRPVSATRVSMQGSVSRGAPALASLLGLRAGRFTVSLEHGPAEAQLDGSLVAQLALQVKSLREGLTPEPEGPAWVTVPSAVTFTAPPARAEVSQLAATTVEVLPAPSPPPPAAEPLQPTITLRLAASQGASLEIQQQTAPLPTLRLHPRLAPAPDPRAHAHAHAVAHARAQAHAHAVAQAHAHATAQAQARARAYAPATTFQLHPAAASATPTASAAPPRPASPRRLRASLQTIAVLGVTLVGLAAGMSLRAYNLATEAATSARTAGK